MHVDPSTWPECLRAALGDAGLRRENLQVAADRIAELEARVADYQTAWRAAMDEQCDANERHCTCVPALRDRVKELEAENAKLKAECEGLLHKVGDCQMHNKRLEDELGRG